MKNESVDNVFFSYVGWCNGITTRNGKRRFIMQSKALVLQIDLFFFGLSSVYECPLLFPQTVPDSDAMDEVEIEVDLPLVCRPNRRHCELYAERKWMKGWNKTLSHFIPHHRHSLLYSYPCGISSWMHTYIEMIKILNFVCIDEE